jgi:hypothetical protein
MSRMEDSEPKARPTKRRMRVDTGITFANRKTAGASSFNDIITGTVELQVSGAGCHQSRDNPYP